MAEPASPRAPVRHIVMWNVAGDTPAERQAGITAVKHAFEGLRGQIPGLMHLEIGIDESRASHACDMVLVTEFENDEALASYATHPAHLAARGRLEGVRVARYQVDYACPTPEGR
ncbi:Dabb family protein [Shinella sp. NM-101]|uniref:Dabb family protein n=1 Tax=Shinella sp. NM-101 TaxID=2744455 RepID=UPI001F3295D2|nr:Dabb family protein [Shinella sp. NM-101]